MYNLIKNEDILIKYTLKSFFKKLLLNDNLESLISNNLLKELFNLKYNYINNNHININYSKTLKSIEIYSLDYINSNLCNSKISITYKLNFIDKKIKSLSTEGYNIILKKVNSNWFIDFIKNTDLTSNSIYEDDYNYTSSLLDNILSKEITHFNSLILNNTKIKPKLDNTITTSSFRSSTHYDFQKAVEYAKKHALNYNKTYTSFDDNGGDCTNFISQVIHHGGLPTSNYWKPYTNSWVRVKELRNYLIYNNLASEFTNINKIKLGSIIQFFNIEKQDWAHSGVVTAIINNFPLYSCHSYDKLNFPLYEVYPSLYPKIRILNLN